MKHSNYYVFKRKANTENDIFPSSYNVVQISAEVEAYVFTFETKYSEVRFIHV